MARDGFAKDKITAALRDQLTTILPTVKSNDRR
jgi:hypothetical protein